MAILLIRIEDLSSLPLNEFFDYNNHCYALTRSRMRQEDVCIDLEDFYEATFQSTCIDRVPVIFVYAADNGKSLQILGWYRSASVYRKVHRKSMFFEGNVIADARDAVLLAEPVPAPSPIEWIMGAQLYEVIEEEDIRWSLLCQLIQDFDADAHSRNVFLRYPYIHPKTDSRRMSTYETCIEACEEIASRIMQNECKDIHEIKLLEQYARRAVSIRRSDADGHYYLSMAFDQLGLPRQGIKSIQKALSLEPDAPDLHGEKASLLVSMGYYDAAAEEYQQAWQLSGEEDYLLMQGRVWMIAGQPAKGYECFRRIRDTALLDRAGIPLKSLERRFPFINIRGFHNLF